MLSSNILPIFSDHRGVASRMLITSDHHSMVANLGKLLNHKHRHPSFIPVGITELHIQTISSHIHKPPSCAMCLTTNDNPSTQKCASLPPSRALFHSSSSRAEMGMRKMTVKTSVGLTLTDTRDAVCLVLPYLMGICPSFFAARSNVPSQPKEG